MKQLPAIVIGLVALMLGGLIVGMALAARSSSDGESSSEPDVLANPPPPPPSNADPFAGCPHRWQTDANGQLIDTGWASEPGPLAEPTSVTPAPTTTVPPPFPAG